MLDAVIVQTAGAIGCVVMTWAGVQSKAPQHTITGDHSK